MANPSPIAIHEKGSRDYKTRLRSYQTPLRKSPRFLPQIDNMTPLVTPNKRPITAINKTRFKSPPNLPNRTQISTLKQTQLKCLMKFGNEPLRSIENLQPSSSTNMPSSSSCKNLVRFSPNLVNPTEILTPMKTQQVCSTKCPNEPLRSIGNLQGSLRRSGRLSSFSSFKIAKELVQSVSQRRRSRRLMGSAKVLEGKDNVSFDGFSEENCQSCRKETVEPLKENRRSLRLMGSVKISEGKENVGTERDENCRSFRKECVDHVKERRRSSRLMGSVKVSEGRDSAGSDGLKEENYKGFTKELVKPRKGKIQSPRRMGTPKEKGREQYVGIDGLNDDKANNANLAVREVKQRKVLYKEKNVNDGRVNLKRKRGTICEHSIEREVDMGKCSDFGEWTRQQDAALQKAYLVAKPSPHFWKKVARMVPGKSAQECFDRVNGRLETPPQPQPRSRSKKTQPSPISSFSLSGSKPVQQSLPLVKKLSSRKKSLVAQKTVRHLLRKHSINDQNHEADHFSVFETSPIQFAMDSPDFSSSTIASPPYSLQKCSGGSSSSHKRMPSRFKPQVSRSSLVSPEVLKRIKNMALHEKYIDQLHNREARRKFAAARGAGARVVKNGEEVKPGIVKAARSALMSEAKEVIFQFQHMQANLQYNYDIDDAEDDSIDGEEDIDDDDEGELLNKVI